MKQQNIFDYINVDGLSLTPKYMQLANSIQDAVNAGKIKNNWILPSLHELTYHLEISKETADRGYKYLRDLGVLSSVPGKGHFVTVSENAAQPQKIFMLLDELNHGRKRFYEVFSGLMGKDTSIDLFIYNNDIEQFRRLLNTRREGYTHYVVLPNFSEGDTRSHELINGLPKDKLILVDRNIEGIDGEFGSVYENLKRSIHKALESQLDNLRKYHTIKILSAPKAFPSPDITWGFNLFCQQYGFDRSVEGNVTELAIKKGEVFICLKDDDLVALVEKIKTQGLQVGEDVGIISFNENPLKQFILNGITTISTDFEEMGIQAARMVVKKQMQRVELECRMVVRESV